MISKPFEKKFKKDISSLSDIFEFTAPFYRQNEIAEDTAYFVSFAIEEVFTNMVKYNKTSDHDISITLEKNNSCVKAVLVDYDVEQFDIPNLDEDDMGKLRDQGALGGRGVYLIHKVVDELHYEYKDNNCYVNIFKKTE